MNVGKERREHPRLEIQRSLNYRIEGDKYINIAYMKNLGGGGLCLQTSSEIEEGTNLLLEFELPESLEHIVASGVVIWVNPSDEDWAKVLDVGVCFTRISDENRRKILDLLSRRLRRMRPPAASGDRDERKTLLVVDSDPEILKALQTLLDPYCKVLVASACSDAVELVLRRSPDVVLVDMMMPDDEGVSLLKIIKSKKNLSAIPVIVTSAIQQEDSIAEAMECGAACFIAKPFTAEALNEKILSLVSGRAQ